MSAGSDGLPERLTGRLERLGLRPDEASRRAGLPPATEPASGAGAATEEELGALLFGIVAAARRNGLDAERALRAANRRFEHNARPGSGT